MLYVDATRYMSVRLVTTGRDPLSDSIISLAMVPADNSYRPDEDHMPFEMLIKADIAKTTGNISRKELEMYGLEQEDAVAQLYIYLDSLNIRDNKAGVQYKMAIVTDDAPLVQLFLRELIGAEQFEYLFYKEIRDIVTIAAFTNDACRYRYDDRQFRVLTAAVVAKDLGIPQLPNRLSNLEKCARNLEVYRRLVDEQQTVRL